MNLTATTFLPVDGVMQGPGGPEEDRGGGFTRGDWLVPHFDEDAGRFMNEVFEQADAFLLGRHTYDIFAALAEGDGPGRPGREPAQHTAQVRRLDHADRARVEPHHGAHRRCARRGGRTQGAAGAGVAGPRQRGLVRTLHEHDLVDEYRLLVFPVVVGEGRRLFPDRGVATGLTLVDSRTTGSGVGHSRVPADRPPRIGLGRASLAGSVPDRGLRIVPVGQFRLNTPICTPCRVGAPSSTVRPGTWRADDAEEAEMAGGSQPQKPPLCGDLRAL